MPPAVFLVIGTVGVVMAARWLARESARINAELHPEIMPDAPPPEVINRLKRDKATGAYRPEQA